MQDLGYYFVCALPAGLCMGESVHNETEFKLTAVCHECGHFQRSSNACLTHPVQGVLKCPQEKFTQGG